MARNDGTEASGDEGGNISGVGSVASVNPVEIDAAASGDTASRVSARTGKPVRGYTPRGQAKTVATASVERKPDKKTAGNPLSVNSVEFALTGIHALLAAGLAAPELELKEAEAKTVAENIVAVARHYDLQQTAKATDWGNLIVSLGIVYGGRVIAITTRTNREAAARRASGAPMGVVVNTAPSHVRVEHPKAAGAPGGAQPLTRPKTEADQALLNEVEPMMV